jgi:uncharacterized protein (DUF58 family)
VRPPDNFYLLLGCRIYVAVALAAALVVSPLAYVAVPLALLLVYLLLEYRAVQARFRLPFYLLLAFALPLLVRSLVGQWIAPALSLPVMPLLDFALRQEAKKYDFGDTRVVRRSGHISGSSAGASHSLSASLRRRPTTMSLTLLLSLVAVAVVAASLRSWTLLLSTGVVGAYLLFLLIRVLHSTRTAPISVSPVSYRVIAGDATNVTIKFENPLKMRGSAALFPLHDWFHIHDNRVTLDGQDLEVKASLAVPLAGPGSVPVAASVGDPWGLVRTDFEMEVLSLLVIPRARYAEWIARKYLEMTRVGTVEVMSAIRTHQRASHSGVEFYGLRPYQPGDSPRIIDWRRTWKLNEVVVKEFHGTGVESAILLTNLSAVDEEQKDRLAWTLITSSLTLARENVPSAMAAYTDTEVVINTPLLAPRQSLVRALEIARSISLFPEPVRYRQVPDVTRLRGDAYRLKESSSEPARRLAAILELEYRALSRAASGNPATRALNTALGRVKARASIVMISGNNHDAVALAFAQHEMMARGYSVMRVALDGRDAGQYTRNVGTTVYEPANQAH